MWFAVCSCTHIDSDRMGASKEGRRTGVCGVTMTNEANSGYREEHVALATGRLRLLRSQRPPSAQRPPLVCLHHSIGSLGWLPVHDLLTTQFDVIVPDMPGYAGSERPDWAREPRDLALILNHLNDALELSDVTLMGTGFGGFFAAEMACANSSRLARLVLVGAAGLKPHDGDIADQMLMSHSAYAQAGFRNAEHYHAVFGDAPSAEVRELWDYSREMSARVTWKPYMFSHRLAPLLGNLKLPTLILWGSADAVVPVASAERYRAAIPGAQLQVIEGAGHCVEMEEPTAVAERIQAFARG